MSTKLIRFHQTAKWNQNTKEVHYPHRQRHNALLHKHSHNGSVRAVKFIFHFLTPSPCLILSSLSYTQIPIILLAILTLTHRDWPHSPTVCRITLCSLHFCQLHSTAQRSRSDFSNDCSPPVTLNKSLSQASGSKTRPSDRHRGRMQRPGHCVI